MKIQTFQFIFFFFLFSFRLLKWIGLPFDPTLIFMLNLIVDSSLFARFKVNRWGFYIPFVYFYCFIFLFPDRFYSPSKSHI
jgi:hypothetical protein